MTQVQSRFIPKFLAWLKEISGATAVSASVQGKPEKQPKKAAKPEKTEHVQPETLPKPLDVTVAEAAETVCRRSAEETGVKARAYQCDVADFTAVKETVARIRADFGTVHILVNNAGITRDGLLAIMKEEDYDAVVDTNLKGAFNMIRHCAGLFIRNREGCIINITSVAGLMGNAGQCNYSASKAGLIGLTKSAARELAPKGIRCNAIAPGFIATDMTGSQTENPLLGTIPLGRMGEPEDVAEAARESNARAEAKKQRMLQDAAHTIAIRRAQRKATIHD